MSAQRSAIPECVDGLVDLDALRKRANAYAINGMKPSSNAKPSVRRMSVSVGALGLAASAVVAIALASAPANRADALNPHDGNTFGEQIKRNVEALQRSRAWWESYGQRHVQP
ncbi:MAG: hypothetical protein WEA28_01185 [Xanthobacteraceae bacterium]